MFLLQGSPTVHNNILVPIQTHLSSKSFMNLLINLISPDL